MTSQLILQVLFSFLPFVVCLFWAICFIAQFRKDDRAKHYLTIYLLTCVVLYLCHGLFFTLGLPYEMECLWTLCSLSVYPLFYGYLCRLTSSEYRVRQLIPWLLPGLLVALLKYLFPCAGFDRVRLLLFALQVVSVCYLGIRKLRAFDKKLQVVYSNTEGRETSAVHNLLVAIISVSLISGVANSVGKHFFGESLWLLVSVSVSFSVLLFSLSYICFNRNFSADQLSVDEEDGELSKEPADPVDAEQIGEKLEQLMTERQYYLKTDLKIGDLVRAIGSNRTYVSNYINKHFGCPFSDYVNRLRVEHAKRLMMDERCDQKLSAIGRMSGFSSDSSFYRNFKKMEDMTPAEWVSLHNV